MVIECKRLTLRQAAKATGRRSDIKADTDMKEKRGVAYGVHQPMRTAAEIRAGRVEGLDARKPIIPLLITLDELHFANAPYIRGIISEVLRENGCDPTGFTYQICSVQQFELLCRLLTVTGQRLSDALLRKLGDREHAQWEFAQWVAEVWPEGKNATLASHAKVRGRIDELLDRYRAPVGGLPERSAQQDGPHLADG